MSGDLQAKRKSKNRSKKKSQLHDLERKEHFGEALQAFGDEEEDTPPSGGINKVDYSETEDTDTVDDDDASQTRKVRSKVGLLTKFLFFSVLVGFLAVAGLSVGMDDYRKYVSPETFKFWGSNCVLPDFQGFQSHLNLDSISKTFEAIKELTDKLVIRPAKDGFRFLLNLVDDEHQSEEQVHVNDDSQDYTPELNEWIRSYDPAEVKERKIEKPKTEEKIAETGKPNMPNADEPKQPQQQQKHQQQEQKPQQQKQQQQPQQPHQQEEQKQQQPKPLVPKEQTSKPEDPKPHSLNPEKPEDPKPKEIETEQPKSKPPMKPSETEKQHPFEDPNLPAEKVVIESSKKDESSAQVEVEEPKITQTFTYSLG